jgi:hypothetical protein
MLEHFTDRADIQEQFIGSFGTVSGGQVVVGCDFVTNIVSCSCVVRVSELEVSWIFCKPIFSLYHYLFL